MSATKKKSKRKSKLQPVKVAVKDFKITPEYVSRLAKQGKVLGEQINGVWHIDPTSLQNFVEQAERKKQARADKLREERRLELELHNQTQSSAKRGKYSEVLQSSLIIFLGAVVGVSFYTFVQVTPNNNLATLFKANPFVPTVSLTDFSTHNWLAQAGSALTASQSSTGRFACRYFNAVLTPFGYCVPPDTTIVADIPRDTAPLPATATSTVTEVVYATTTVDRRPVTQIIERTVSEDAISRAIARFQGTSNYRFDPTYLEEEIDDIRRQESQQSFRTQDSLTDSIGDANVRIDDIVAGDTVLDLLSITGTSTFYGSAIVDSILTVTGLATLNDGLSLTGGATFDSSTTTDSFITNLSVDDATVGNATTTNATTTNQFVTNLEAQNSTLTTAEITDLLTTNATTTNATTTNQFITDLVAQNSTTTNAYIASLVADSASLTDADITNLINQNATTTNATTTNSYIGSLRADSSTTTDAYITNLAADDAAVTNATTTNFFASVADVVSGFFTNLTATVASIVDLTTTDFVAQNATTTNSYVQNQAVDSASVTDATFTNATTTNQFITDLVAQNSTTTNLAVSGRVLTDLIPVGNQTLDLGSAGYYWRNAYIDDISVNNLSAASTTISGTASNNFTVNSDNSSADAEDANLVFYRGTVAPNAILGWDSTNNRFTFNQDMYQSSGDFETTGDTTLGGTLSVSGLVNLTGGAIIDNSTTTRAYITDLLADNATTTNQFVTNLEAQNSTLTTAEITDLLTTNATTTNATTTNQFITDLVAQNSTTTNAYIASLVADSASLTDADITNLINQNATTTNATTTNSYVTNLQADNATSTTNTVASAQYFSFLNTGSIPFIGADGLLIEDNANFFWDATNDRLGIGLSIPSVRLHVDGGDVQFNDASNNPGFYFDESTGRTGLGTTAPSTKLDVDGTVTATGVTSSGTVNFSDLSANRIVATDISNNLVSTITESNLESSVSGVSNIITNNDTTSDLSEGSNLYFTNTRARNAISSSATGLSYNSGTGAFSLTSGYSIPLTASTTNWNTFYDTPSNRITAGTGIDWSTNTLNVTGVPASSLSLTQGYIFRGNASNAAEETSDLFIDGSGNVGIGTTAPSNKLSVSGDANFTGNVGIGTTSPAVKLDVVSTDTDVLKLEHSDGSTVNLDFEGTLGTAQIGLRGINELAFSGGGSERMRIDQSGNVGIGTTNPSAPLHIETSSTQAAIFDSEGSSSYAQFTNSGGTTGYIGSAGAFAAGGLNSLGLRSENEMVFATGGSTERVRIDSSGNVGIGTTSPATNLHVEGSGGEQLYVTASDVSGAARIKTFGYGQSEGLHMGQHSTGNSFLWNAADGDLHFGTDNSVRMRITNTGNVGIGTTAPSTKLDVDGTVTATGVTSSGTVNFSDLSANRIVATDISNNLVSTITESNLESSVSGVSNIITNNDTTSDLSEGSNLYFTNTRARNAISSSATGLSYNSGTGAFSLTSGYSIPLTASTTNWNTFYDTPSNRITAGTDLTWSGNTLNYTGTITDTTLSESEVEDFAFNGSFSGNTETLITVDYQTADNTVDFTVEDDLSLYDNTTSGFITDDTSVPKGDLVNSGTLGYDWSDSEVADDLTISGSGSVADGALSSNVSLLGSSIALGELNFDPLTEGELNTESKLESQLGDVSNIFTNNDTITSANIADSYVLNTGDTISGNLSADGYLETGNGSGGVALTINDGSGNANLAFNHRSGTPDSNGSSARITSNVDSTTAGISFQLQDSVTDGVAVATTEVLDLTLTAADFAVNLDANAGLTLTGSASNITLGNNYLSGDGDDEGVFVDNSGNVGIGNTSPSSILELGEDAPGDSNYLTIGKGFNADSGIQWTRGATVDSKIYSDASERMIFETDVNSSGLGNADFIFQHSGSELMRIKDNGNVGIGTTSPEAVLQIQTTEAISSFTTTGSPNVRIGGNNGTSPSTPTVLLDNGSKTWGIDNLSSGDDLRFVYNSASVPVTFTDTGNVGIGTTNPQDRLDIGDGLLRVQGKSDNSYHMGPAQNFLSGVSIRAISNPSNNETIFGVESVGSASRFGVTQNNGTWARDGLWSGQYDDGVLSRDVGFVHDGNEMQIFSNGTEQIRIKGNGDVGIGTTNPSHKLEILGAGGNNSGISLKNGNGQNVRFFLKTNGSGSRFAINLLGSGGGDIQVAGNGNVLLAESSGGKVGIDTGSPGYKLEVAGSAGKPGGGSWSNSSDERLKENVVDLNGGALEKISQLRGVTFDWKNPGEHGGTAASGGFIAQEVMQVFPQFVSEIDCSGADCAFADNGKIKSLTLPFTFDAYLVEGIKELDSRTQAIVSDSIGNVGIGTTAPSTKLDVSGSTRIYNQTPTTGVSTLSVRAGAGQATNPLQEWLDNSGNSLAVLDSSGRLGIGTTNPSEKLVVDGTIRSTNLTGGAVNLTTDASGNIIRDPSDIRLKTNVADIDSALDKLLDLRGVSYEWRDTQRFGDQIEIGFIAQEVDSIVPEVVRKGGDYWSINTRNLLAIVVEGIKEIWNKVTSNTDRIEILERELCKKDNSYEWCDEYDAELNTESGSGDTEPEAENNGSNSQIPDDADDIETGSNENNEVDSSAGNTSTTDTESTGSDDAVNSDTGENTTDTDESTNEEVDTATEETSSTENTDSATEGGEAGGSDSGTSEESTTDESGATESEAATDTDSSSTDGSDASDAETATDPTEEGESAE